MIDRPEFREGASRPTACGDGETPLFNCQFTGFCHPERTGVPSAPASGAMGWGSEGPAFCDELQVPRFARDDKLFWGALGRRYGLDRHSRRLIGTARVALVILLVVCGVRWATASPSAAQPPAEAPAQSEATSGAQFGAITSYLGLAIDRIELPGVPPEEAAALLGATPLKIGEPLTRDALHDAMQALFATGRFSDIQAEAGRTETAGVRLRFLTVANFFVGMVAIEGVTTNPSANQLASATRLELGELYAKEKLDRALAGIERVLEENGFHESKVTISEQRDEPQHQVNLTFHVVLGARALVGEIALEGDAGYSIEQIEEIGKLHPGDPAASNRMGVGCAKSRGTAEKPARLRRRFCARGRAAHIIIARCHDRGANQRPAACAKSPLLFSPYLSL